MKSQEQSFRFVKVVISTTKSQFKNIYLVPKIVNLYEKFFKFLVDDYFLNTYSRSVDAVVEMIEKSNNYFWAILEKNSGDFVGFAFLDNWVGDFQNRHSAEITTCFCKKYWGNPTKICAKKFVKYCFKRYGLKKLKATVFSDNTRVRKLLNTIGFRHEARLYSETIRGGKLQDIDIFSLIQSKGDNKNGIQ